VIELQFDRPESVSHHGGRIAEYPQDDEEWIGPHRERAPFESI
jgi:hypothetical protein